MNNPFKKTYSLAEREKFAFLEKVKFFKHLTYDEMSQFLPAIHQRKHVQDEVVFFRNDPSQALYILEKGEVTLNIDIRTDFETIIKIKEGEPFGENSLLENSKRSYFMGYPELCHPGCLSKQSKDKGKNDEFPCHLL